MPECQPVPKQNLYAQRRNAHIVADQDPRVYEDSWNNQLTKMKRRMLILLTHLQACICCVISLHRSGARNFCLGGASCSTNKFIKITSTYIYIYIYTHIHTFCYYIYTYIYTLFYLISYTYTHTQQKKKKKKRLSIFNQNYV